MRKLAFGATAAVVLALVAAEAHAGDKAAGCGNHGTSLEFVGTPKEAAKKAAKEEKLVFVLHISGHFEDPALT